MAPKSVLSYCGTRGGGLIGGGGVGDGENGGWLGGGGGGVSGGGGGGALGGCVWQIQSIVVPSLRATTQMAWIVWSM
jgi:hypothetical protein